MKFFIGTVVGFIAAVLILLWASMNASPANADQPSLSESAFSNQCDT